MSHPNRTRRRIRAAVAELTPVRPYRPGALAAAWLAGAVVVAALGMALVQPFRSGVPGELVRHPGFAVESLLGLFAVVAAARATLAAAVPAGGSRVPWSVLAVATTLLWLAFLAVTLVVPSTPPSMDGKRDACSLEVLLWSVPLALTAAALQRRGLPLAPRRAALLAGLTAGLIPAWLMQFACMHGADHGLLFHVGPVLLEVPGALLLAPWIGGRRRAPGSPPGPGNA